MTQREFERKHGWKRAKRRFCPMKETEREQKREDDERANDPRLARHPEVRRALATSAHHRENMRKWNGGPR